MANHRPKRSVHQCGSDPPGSWDDRKNEEYLVPPGGGRGADLMFTGDEPYPVRSEPAPMDFQAPLHTPYGTAERTWTGFWGEENYMLERRNLLPPYAISENEWDRNPRECGKQKSERSLNPYEDAGSFNSATGASSARSMDVKDASMTQYLRVYQTSNPTAYGADPIIGRSTGGGVPHLGPYIGRGGSDKPSWTPGYIPPAGGSMPSAPPVEPYMQLPSASRSNRHHEEMGNVTGGNAVSDYGDEMVNPQSGGRPSLLATDYEYWGSRNGGFVSGGADWEAGGKGETIWNPNDGARYRNLPEQGGAHDPAPARGPVPTGPSLDFTPKTGGRTSMNINFDIVNSGGVSAGVGSSLGHNPQDGGRTSKFINFGVILPGGLTTGLGSSLVNNPSEGGRVSMKKNWDDINPGGATSGLSGVGISDIVGGEHWARTEGCPGYVPPGGAQCPEYGGIDVAFGLEVSPRVPRVESSITANPGVSGSRGTPKEPEMYITLPNTRKNGNGVYDDSPDPILQLSARSLMGARALLDFSRENLDDLTFSVPCI